MFGEEPGLYVQVAVRCGCPGKKLDFNSSSLTPSLPEFARDEKRKHPDSHRRERPPEAHTTTAAAVQLFSRHF